MNGQRMIGPGCEPLWEWLDLTRERSYWDTHCRYCEAPLRRDGGCSMWYGEPHDLPYRERQAAIS